MPRPILFLLTLGVILVASYVIYTKDVTPNVYKPGTWPEADTAVNQAQNLYDSEKEKGTDFSSGPCLSNSVIPGWVVDIAHSPRKPIDDLPENQCRSYVEGQAKHFVELDPQGKVLRVK